MTVPRSALRTGVLALAAALVVALAGAHDGRAATPTASTPTACATAPAAGTYAVTVSAGGLQRMALVHVPATLPTGVPAPLLLALHGAYGNGPGMQSYSGFSTLADSDDFIVAYPSSDGNFWNIGAAAGQPDDVAFISALITTLESTLCIDTSRVFAAGVSNGAGMVALLACDLSTQLDGIAAVAGDYSHLPRCHLKRPVPLLEIHGTADQIAAYYGSKRAHATADGLPPFVNQWATRDGCTGTPTTRRIATRATLVKWASCSRGTTVEHIRITGGKHQWPGATPPDPGPPATISASSTIWSYFSQIGPQHLPPPATSGAPTSGGAPEPQRA
ncbi:MAG TPA: PHB depolymerase family esterase [Solirubrobacteraceae bacterium]|jgi:polyhydroxybutyrate depolymerase|nr:PHB depolymerase family esterase [Solirubrobacteraceae bacterium]